ncbi:hypothetical protein SNOG_03770 [Parastagonospora nodorum SN15]|uniref:Uncharacterized protein n=1 Tax=Phaeosphaeria nodorum (strain SN15 / ATCC MYA-4574 / FGSC 10173) TaxID=321614 RepID=Q0UWU4_PHANO|nr:hypothetical protein SNOG_03770 [Parastagonospora nodorum SN15]EAT88975.2 hypothetical protein SNOG_03770 [Parastagonospora nodorum SN15]
MLYPTPCSSLNRPLTSRAKGAMPVPPAGYASIQTPVVGAAFLRAVAKARS